MAYVQLVRPGVAVVLGSFGVVPPAPAPTGTRSLRPCSTSWQHLHGGSASLWSGGAFTASKVPDAQAAYESANTMQPTLAGVNFVLHAAGWLEGGLTMGYEKFVLDNDQCGMWHEFAKGVDTSENGQALDALLTNGPGQHYLGHEHTGMLANFETAFYRLPAPDNSSFEQWEAEGDRCGAARGADLEEDARGAEAPPIDDAVDEELREWIERKKASFPDSDY